MNVEGKTNWGAHGEKRNKKKPTQLYWIGFLYIIDDRSTSELQGSESSFSTQVPKAHEACLETCEPFQYW